MEPVRRARVSVYEALELANVILGMGLDFEDDADYDKVEEALFDKFSVFPDEFTDIISRLIPLILVGRGITKATYRGFGIDQCFIVKEEVK